MKKLLLTIVWCVLCAAAIRTQTPVSTATPSATPNTTDDGDVVKISTTLIQVDVTVTDRNGKIVGDLNAEDFEIFENGRKQEITNFSFVRAASDAASAPEKPSPNRRNDAAAAPLPPSVALRPEQVRRTIALVVDDLGLSFESVYQVRRALRKFVDQQMQPNDLVAVIRTGNGAGALQQFTSDKRQLYAAIEAVKWNSRGRAGISAFAPLEATPLEQTQGSDASQEDLDEEQRQLGAFDDFREDIFSIGTLGAINFIVKGMNDLPGRKSIMLFSDGFQICSPENPDRCARIVESVKQLTDLSNRAAVSIYSFDARGLLTTGITAQDNTSGVSAARVQNLSSSRSKEIFDKQEGLAYLAAETGGRTFFNNNDMSSGLEKALEDQKGFYLIGYAPDSETFDAKTRRFNKLQIKVGRKNTNVRYRSGFFGIADDQIKKPSVRTAAQEIYTALTSPFAVGGIGLRLNTLFGFDKIGGSYVRSLLHVNAGDLTFAADADGGRTAMFDVLAVSFGENGAAVDQISKSYTMKIKNERYQKFADEGFVYYFTLPVKKPGAYQYRVAIRDTASGKVGAANQFIEVPNLKKNRLTISGIVLENLTAAQWDELNADAAPPANTEENNAVGASNPLTDTSLRRFKRGTILRYGFEVYNAKLDAAQKPNVTVRIRVFRDGKIILDGKSVPLQVLTESTAERQKSGGGLNLGNEMKPGDYVLQIISTDNLAKKKQQIAAQFVQFEIVE